ncbi:MAG: hypothetical protein RIA65_08725 [Woeseia sp.]
MPDSHSWWSIGNRRYLANFNALHLCIDSPAVDRQLQVCDTLKALLRLRWSQTIATSCEPVFPGRPFLVAEHARGRATLNLYRRALHVADNLPVPSLVWSRQPLQRTDDRFLMTAAQDDVINGET